MTQLPNTSAPAVASFALVSKRIDFGVFNAQASQNHLQAIAAIDFYRSPAMDENLQKVAKPVDPKDVILERVRDYGAAVRVHGVGPEVTEKYKAVVEAVKGVAA
jgi:hypothetical protein